MKKVSKIILIISFFPYLIILLISLYCAIFGFDVYQHTGIPDTMVSEFEYSNTDYGIDAFFLVLKSLIFVFSIWIPILPVILGYQVLCLIIFKIKSLGKVGKIEK